MYYISLQARHLIEFWGHRSKHKVLAFQRAVLLLGTSHVATVEWMSPEHSLQKERMVATVLRDLSADSVPQCHQPWEVTCFFSLSFSSGKQDCTRWSLKSFQAASCGSGVQRLTSTQLLLPSGPLQHPLWSPLQTHDKQHIYCKVPHLYNVTVEGSNFSLDSASWVPEVRRKGNVEYQRHPSGRRLLAGVPHSFFFL